MYRVTVLTDGVEYMLHDIHSENEQIYDDELSETMGRTETFNFTIDPTHPNIDKIKTLTSEIRIYKDGTIIFFGRSITPSWDMYNANTVYCVGGLSYLADSIIAPFELTGSVDDLMTQLLAVHNSMVAADKQFRKGIVNVAGTFITRTLEEYTPTLDVLHNLLDVYNGYLRARKNNGINYLDFVSDYGGINSQVIRFGQNILDVQKGADAAELITCLIPEGDSVDITNPDGTTGSQTVDITSVNGGKNYIESAIGVAKWGRIFGYVKFEGITDPATLLQEATTYLANKILLPETIELTALDLSYMDTTVDAFKIGLWTQCESKPHSLSGTYLLKKMVRHLTAPQNDKIILGETQKTLTGTVADTAKNLTIQIGKVKQSTSKEIEQKVNNATSLITGGLGGYVVLDVYDPNTGEKIHPWRILIMDSPDKNTANSVIQINRNGIGFSTTGINGPYRNAWTIDGNLVADFITTGTMLADRIRGGMLELGGTGLGKDGSITVKNAAGAVIGTWDKTGLHVLLGVIEGSTIRGSSIIGGAINIGSGTFTVDSDGEVTINAGVLNLGPVSINSNYSDLGAFRVSNAQYGMLYSTNGEVVLSTSSLDDSGPSLELKRNGITTRVGYGGINTVDIFLKALYDRYGGSWGFVSDNIIELWNRIESIENSL
ncbi:phage tail spike protein [Lacrimispora sp.]|uniref:phage tail spike protein n=1 Tax=Lacrimispora sp. TaxID=2719234 RepID=UPI0028B20B09|nr:phage tail spike protein [Lacrimispora sp.]